MSNYIVDISDGRIAKTITDRERSTGYTVIESNENGIQVIQDEDEGYWIEIPLEDDTYQLHPAIKSDYPSL